MSSTPFETCVEWVAQVAALGGVDGKEIPIGEQDGTKSRARTATRTYKVLLAKHPAMAWGTECGFWHASDAPTRAATTARSRITRESQRMVASRARSQSVATRSRSAYFGMASAICRHSSPSMSLRAAAKEA